MMDTSLQKDTGQIWRYHYAKTAFASEAIVHIMSKEGFSSTEVRRLFGAASSFGSTLRIHRSEDGPSVEDNRLLGAVLNKLALRGMPAPCSLKVERYILKKAQGAGLLVFEESSDNSKIKFSCTPLIEDFDLMLRICCLPELLCSDSEVDVLLQCYEALLESSEPMKRFFDKLLGILPDRRLALFVIPGCLLGPEFGKRILKSKGQVDFVVQIPNLKTKKVLRIAICLGENGDCCDGADGWIVKRFDQKKQQYWESELRKLVDQICYAIQDDVLTASRRLREGPLEKKMAIQELIWLPMAEAQLTKVIADLIYRSGDEKTEIAIGNPQKLNLAVALEAVGDMIKTVSSLYGITSPIELRLADDGQDPDIEYRYFPEGGAFSRFYERAHEHAHGCINPTLCLSCGSIQLEALPRPISCSKTNGSVRNGLRFILNNVFRCQEFLEDQEELVEQMLSLRGSIGLLKPGGGKTLAYQLASIIQPGTALVVVPTRYSIIDQECSLSARGIHRARAIIEPIEEREQEWEQDTLDSIDDGSYFLFLTADMLQNRGYRAGLDSTFSSTLNFLVIEEAHVLSEWSHGFQVGYLNLIRYCYSFTLMKSKSEPSPIALTSVNSRLVLLDIMIELDLGNPHCILESTSYDSNRRNLQYEIRKASPKNRIQVLISTLRATLREYGRNAGSKIPSGLVIFAHEDDEGMNLTSFYESMGQYLNIRIRLCSLNPPKKFLRLGGSRENWERISSKALQQFKSDELPVLVCSADAAMALGKEDIRFTLNVGIPASLEEFYRQSGKAGRDGKESSCLIFYSDDGEGEASTHEEVSNAGTRNLESMAQEFPGRMMEKRILSRAVLKLLSPASGHNVGDIVDTEIFILSFPDRLFLTNGDLRVSPERKQKLLEKALYRLLLLGAIKDYEKGPGSFRVTVITSEASYIYTNYNRYINRYEIEGLANPHLPKEDASSYKNAVLKCGCKLIDYGYHRIKTEKAADTAKMLQAAEVGLASVTKFRDYLHGSMEKSDIAAMLADATFESVGSVLEEIKGQDDLLGLFLACRRELKVKPEDPVIGMIMGLCAQAFPEIRQEGSQLMKGFSSLKSSTTTECRLDVARQIVSCVELLMPSQRDLILKSIWQADSSLEISRLCYQRSGFPSEICYSSLFELVNGLLEYFKAEGV